MSDQLTSDGMKSDNTVPGWPTAAPADVVGTCPAPRTAPATADEWVEIALSYMWCRFAREVVDKKGPTDIHWAAVQHARDGLRGRLSADIKSVADLTTFINSTYAAKYEQEWLETARGCANGSAMILIEDMNRSWVGAYGPRHEQADLWAHASEVIGGQLWFRFVVGAARNDANPISLEVIIAGRGLSADHVRTNAPVYCVDGECRIDYSRWDWDGVALCCWMAGKYSSSTANAKEIKEFDFRNAWCQVRDEMAVRIAALEEVNITFMTSACG